MGRSITNLVIQYPAWCYEKAAFVFLKWVAFILLSSFSEFADRIITWRNALLNTALSRYFETPLAVECARRSFVRLRFLFKSGNEIWWEGWSLSSRTADVSVCWVFGLGSGAFFRNVGVSNPDNQRRNPEHVNCQLDVTGNTWKEGINWAWGCGLVSSGLRWGHTGGCTSGLLIFSKYLRTTSKF